MYGRQDIGSGELMVIFGSLARGCSRLLLVTCGRLVIGDGEADLTLGMKVIGDTMSVSMAALLMAAAIMASVLQVAVGAEADTSSTVRL